ncbi:hypothetical protein [Streptomyces sp. NBC_00728]|uniref:hypothetical protein n=1 Tax=Streptomyces sp. NBC_00728 TaxID=2903676 RepID=UPI0038698E28
MRTGRGGPGGGLGRALSAAAFANLLIGGVGIVPGLCVRWLLTRFPSVHCDGPFGCHRETPDNALGLIAGAVLGGGFVLGMVLVVDILMPYQEGRPMGPWLSMTALVPAPLLLGQAVGWF